MSTVFRAAGVSVSFGGVKAVVNVDLDVDEGQVVGLIGPNGAGKTTFIDAITGFVKYSGTVELAGTRLDGLAPHARARRGLARTWQTVELFDDLSVRENLTVAARGSAHAARGLRALRRGGAGAVSVDEELALLQLDGVADAMPSELTQAERKRAGIGRALVAQPRLLCLDEPGAGLDARQSRELSELLPRLAAKGAAILLVDHDMGLVLGSCDQVVVLDYGSVIAKGAPAAIRGDTSVVAAYLGRSTSDSAVTPHSREPQEYPESPAPPASPAESKEVAK
jgi:branched-chain amino acid transport system ATP-binding protein